jgi:hypothetical protein
VGLVWGGNAQPVQDGPGQGDTVGHLPPAPPATITRQGQVVNIRAPQCLRQPEIQLVNFTNSFNLTNPSFFIQAHPYFIHFQCHTYFLFFNQCFGSGSALMLVGWNRFRTQKGVLWNRKDLLWFQVRKNSGSGSGYRQYLAQFSTKKIAKNIALWRRRRLQQIREIICK